MTHTMKAQAGNGLHPEVILGIPFRVITAKGANKQKEAVSLGYDGPLTLQEAIDNGIVSEEDARYLAHKWQHFEAGMRPSPFSEDTDRKSRAAGDGV